MKNKKASEEHEIENKLDELTCDLKRVQAEFENFKKRTEKESRKYCDNANAEMIKKLLPVLDTFDTAVEKSNDKGMRLVYGQLVKILKDEGLKEIDSKGKFNPDLHEAMLQQSADDFDDDEIVEVMQKGYMVMDIVIRPAKVKINVRKTSADGKEKDSEEKNSREKNSEEKKGEENKYDN